MREKAINRLLNLLNNTYNYDNDTLDRVKYGLETIYISITKMVVILFIAIIFGTTKETILTILFVNGIRTYAYGMHAKKSWHCYIESTLVFVLLPYLFTKFTFNITQKILISIISIIGYLVYAPADTHKRPIINKKHRNKLKNNSIIVCLIYIFIIFLSNNNLIINIVILSLVTELFLINPIIYKIFDMPYNNYLTYQSK